MAKQTKQDQPDVSDFDYKKLTGDAWDKYATIATELKLNEKYFFEEWNAVLVTKFALDEDTGAVSKRINGIQLMASEPSGITAITGKNARDLNQFATPNKGDRNSKYYLLARASYLAEKEVSNV